MNGLRSYRGRHLELADMLRAAMHLARSRSDAAAEEQARELLSRLAADRFRLAVVGQFSRGKSTLMNALLGGAYLPMGALPMTAVITIVRYGSHPKAMVRRLASTLPVEVPLAQVADFVAASSVQRAEMRVATVEVEVPAEVLRLGFEFIDTPGVGSAITASTATARRFLPQADAVIFVTGFDSPLTEAEASFLADASWHAGKLFLILNKRDVVSDRDAADIHEFVRRRVRADLGIPEPRIFALSALEALEGVLHGDQARLSASGLPGLRVSLEEFLTTDKTRLFLDNIARRAAQLVSAVRRDLRLGRLAGDGGVSIPEVLAAFDARMADLAGQQHAATAMLGSKIALTLPGLLAERSAAWRQDLRDLLGPVAEEALSASTDAGTVRAAVESARARLDQAGQDVTSSWLRRRAGEVHELLSGLASDQIGVLLETPRAPGAIGAQIAGLAESGDRHQPAGWTAGDLPDLTVRAPEWSVSVPQLRRPRRQAGPADPEVRQRLTDALGTAITVFEEQARTQLQDSASDWAGRLEKHASRELSEAAERFRRNLRTPPADEELAAADDLVTKLAAFRTALATGVPADAGHAADQDPTLAPSPGASGDGACVVCARLEETLGEQLRRDQFLLATRELDQARHTLAGGYCPLHTWQYASVASPLGISAGYAKLAARVAETLESAAERDWRREDLARSVAVLTLSRDRCALCRALAAAEREAIAAVITARSADRVLCLRHLALVLAADPPAEAARSMLRATAVALRRDSEDMRGYALKREALHSWLVSDEESRAHLDALRRLAGPSSLTLPWTDVAT